MIKACGGFRFPSKAFQMPIRRPMTKANYFKSNCAIETLLQGAVNYTLAAASNL